MHFQNTVYVVTSNSMAIVTVFNQYETSLWISTTDRIFCIFEMECFYDVSFSDWKYSRRHVEMTKTRFPKFSFNNEHKIQNKSRLLLLLAHNQYNFTFSASICPYFCHCMVNLFDLANGDSQSYFSVQGQYWPYFLWLEWDSYQW